MLNRSSKLVLLGCALLLFVSTALAQKSDAPVAADSTEIVPPPKPLDHGLDVESMRAKGEARSDDPWDGWPSRYKHYIGYEGGGNAASVLGTNIAIYGWWKQNIATEIFAGFTKSGNTLSSSSSTNSSANGSTSTSAYTGANSPYVLTVGLGQNFRLSHVKWIQVYAGYLAGITYTTSTSYSTGTTTTNTSSPGNSSVTYSGVGSANVSTDPLYFVGAKLGADFFVKWFPNLALGFATGLLTTFDGAVTTSTTTRDGTDTYTNGVANTPSPVTSTSSSASTTPGPTATTFGIGGTVFQLTGTFTIRYLW